MQNAQEIVFNDANSNAENAEVVASSKKKALFEDISFYVLWGMAFILPFFVLPALSIYFSKVVLIAIATIVVLILWVIARLKDTTFNLPINIFTVSSLAIPAAFILSTLFSGAISQTFFGAGYEAGSTVSIIIGWFLMFFMSVLLHRRKERIFAFYIAFFTSFFVITLFQLLRIIFGAGFLSMGVFTDTSANLIGRFTEMAVFFGLTLMLSLVTFQVLAPNRLFKILAWSVLIISLFFLAVVNFFYVWLIVGLFTLVSSVYAFVIRRKVAVSSVIILAVSLVFLFFGSTIHDHFPTKLNIPAVEVYPAWTHTFTIAKETLKHDPVFGVGPSQFTQQWLTYKPTDVNTGMFWNVDFPYGTGLIPTYIITTGILGFLAWVVFFIFFLRAGFKAIFSPVKETFSRYLVISSFFAALYLWIFQIIYVPSPVLFYMAFLFTGVFIASLWQDEFIQDRVINYARDPRISFASVLVLLLLLIGGIALAYNFGQKVTAIFYFQRAAQAMNVKGDVASAEGYLRKAIGHDNNSDYRRTQVEIDILKMNAVLSQKNVPTDTIKAEFTPILGSALDSAKQAVNSNAKDYQNWLSLGKIYEAVIPLGYQGAYEQARDAYTMALGLNPHNPAIILTRARLEAEANNVPGAKNFAIAALNEKPNYTDAIYFLAQMEINSGNLKGAIDSVQQAAYINPNDPTVFFELGFLKYSNKDYVGAVPNLEQAVALNSQYSNARYFLGLSYDKLGRTDDAIAQFTEIQKYNADNKEVQQILKNLKAGKPALGADVKPEKRSKPPIKEALKKATPPADATSPDNIDTSNQ